MKFFERPHFESSFTCQPSVNIEYIVANAENWIPTNVWRKVAKMCSFLQHFRHPRLVEIAPGKSSSKQLHHHVDHPTLRWWYKFG